MSHITEVNTRSKAPQTPTSYHCRKCNSQLAISKDFFSSNFRGQHGKAILFDTAINLESKAPVKRQMTTGVHIVQDAHCQKCKEYIGWQYKETPGSQNYKLGKYCLEKEMLLEVDILTCAVIYACKTCGIDLAESEDCGFQGDHGKAKLFAKATNFDLDQPIDRQMRTGLNRIQLAYCRQCRACVGGLYNSADVESEKYKEGKYLLEMELMVERESQVDSTL